jgi:N-acetylglucosaminyl-diphospho-decaprenol L-rhamnosyltransferase
MDLSVIVVSHNHARFLPACLASLATGAGRLEIEAFVVDNCSIDGSAEVALTSLPEVRLLRSPTPRGFAANNNAAIRLSRGRYVALLNPDTAVRERALETLVAFMEANVDVGICGPQLRFPNGGVQASCRRFPTWRSALARRTPLRRFLWNSPLNAHHLMADADHGREQMVDWMLGACLVVRRAAIEEVGLLDEGFFLYVEDIDWCYRMWRQGWKVAYVPSAQVTHHHLAETDRRWLTRRTWIHYRSISRFVWKHYLRPRLGLLPARHPT